MSVARSLTLLAVALLVAAPAADAYVQPVFYFLKDAPQATDGAIPPLPIPPLVPIPVPTVDPNAGVLDPFDPLAPNAPNSSTSRQRYVPVGSELVLPVQFVSPADAPSHPTRIKGNLFMGLWTGQSAVYQGNLSATLYEIPPEGEPIPLASVSQALDFNQSTAPDPTALIPANTTDPQAIVFYELAQVMPMLLHPPALFVMPLDVNLTSTDSRLALGLMLEQGSSPAPLPIGATASVQYDGLVTPSFVYVPFYTPDPPRATPTPRPGSSFSNSRSPTFGSGGGQTTGAVDGGEQESPGLGVPLAVLALAALAVSARRRFG